MTDPKAAVCIIRRLDQGDPEERGLFQCSYEGCDWIMTTSRQNAHKHVTRDHPGMQPRVERQQKRMRSSAHIENDGSPMQPTKVGALVFYRHVAHYHYRSHAWTISLDP